MKQALLNNVKNIYGWKTKRKIVVISVDDYGNVRLDSKLARHNLDKLGFKAVGPTFDNFDTLENTEDLNMLYDTLTSVKDKNGKHAIFTPFSLPCNIDFETMKKNDYTNYVYELLPVTFEKLEANQPKAYLDTWKLWKEGIEMGIMKPQFHGREHFNLRVFQESLKSKNKEVLAALENRSFTGILETGYSTIKRSAAFSFSKLEENKQFKYIIEDGLNQFENVFGYKSTHFNPPGGREHSSIHKYLFDCGIKYLDTPLIKQEHQGEGKYVKVYNYTGKKNNLGMIYQVRNVVFEPINKRNFSWVDYTLKQIETAFFWKRPAIVSSHRVNFCGHINPKNRKKGIDALQELLKKIVAKWPDVEFMSADQLGDIIAKK